MKFNLLSTASFIAMSGAVIAGMPGAANATLTLTESNAYAMPVATNYGSGGTTTWASGSQTLNLTGFNAAATKAGVNPSSVTLQSVQVTVLDTVAGQASAVASGGDGTFYFSYIGDTLTATASTGLTVSGLSVQALPSIGSSGAPIPISSGQTLSYNKLGGTGTSSQTVTGTSLSSYLSGWTISFNETVNTLNYASGSGIALSDSTTGDVKVTTVYTYSNNTTPAPEPASIAILASALTGVGVIRRRRKS